MMPSGTPRVPYKFPGTQDPTWIDIYSRMYRERIMFLGQDIDDSMANQIIAVLLYLESEDAKSPIAMYFNVRDGALKAGLAMHDTMRIMPYEIQTVNMGMCAQVAAYLVAAGTPGKRYALPNAQFRMENPRIDPPVDNEGKPRQRIMQATEMQLEVQEALRDKKRMLLGLSQFTGRPVETLEQDYMRDFYLSAKEATKYGLVDQLLMPKPPVIGSVDSSIGLG
jgi:ATP-dependent Clp protease protease subunit